MSLGGWVNDYVVAEQRQAESGEPIFIFYKDHLDPLSGRVDQALRDGDVKSALAGTIACKLVKDYAPDRAYVAQYGVDRAPAIILIHPDGTYHAHLGAINAAGILAFLERAKPPGERPRQDAYIPRPFDPKWHSTLDRATEAANQQGKPTLIVFKWWLGADDWKLMRAFDAPEVQRVVEGCVLCRLDYDYLPNRNHLRTFGLTRTPAVVVRKTDGSYRTLEGLVPPDDLVRFLRDALSASPAQTNGQ
ncbi:MAG: hypothetical protein BroJett003_11050 [Planctomycetota bacterium]|nr:MAG: hypothetical protein BroJett003_11050 [Planctomycetota bacterium]